MTETSGTMRDEEPKGIARWDDEGGSIQLREPAPDAPMFTRFSGSPT